MSIKRLAAVMALALFAQTAFSQKSPSPGTHITVSKRIGAGMYFTVQDAVNAAKPGQVIEILDEEIYNEQVTIDGREDTHWPGVTGGKYNITLRYVPVPGVAAKPTIKWQDITNRSPKNPAEAKVLGDHVGASGNYETCGALRILRTSGITIEGIIIDGGGSAPFAWSGIWCGDFQCYSLFHGNSAIAVVVSGNVQIRDCESRNAYFGIFVKDRNIGGVFANPNPSDIDITVPLSGFGKTGNHLFEYNKIYENDIGIRFESLWDLGSTVRYNLIYSNYHKPTITMPSAAESSDWTAGAIFFKDTYLSPVAIYNNTFYDNTMNLIGNWQIGYQHLIFNNIFSKLQSGSMNTGYMSSMAIEDMFPNRMHNNVLAASNSVNAPPVQFMCLANFNCAANAELAPGGCYVEGVQFDGFKSPLKSDTIRLTSCNSSIGYTMNAVIVKPGALIPGSRTNGLFPTDANNRWLETAGYTETAPASSLPVLFKSINPASPEFLVPDWEHQQVKDFIRNGGWPASGIINVDGTVADLGAIPYSGKRPCDNSAPTSRVRVVPASVASINGTEVMVDIAINQEIGSITSPKIKYIYWIAPIPDNRDSFGYDGKIIPATSVVNISTAGIPALSAGVNSLKFTLPKAPATTDEYGFFELVIEGKDGSGKTVVSDVGFLPFRQANNGFVIRVVSPTTKTADGKPLINVGEPVTLRVVAMSKASGAVSGTPFTGEGPISVDFKLSSDPESRMYRVIEPVPGSPLESDSDLKTGAEYTKEYTVYFTKSGDEVISAAGLWNGPIMRTSFHGSLAISVQAGPPTQVAFLNPLPKRQIPAGGFPPSITGYYEVEVQVQDKFGNVSPASVKVDMASSAPDIGAAVPYTAMTYSATGVALFTAQITNGEDGDIFDLIASATFDGVVKPDTASLRVGPPVSVLTPDRVVPPPSKEEATVIAPVVILSSKFTAGPNPVLKQSGMIKFYRQGKQVASSELRIYDVTGNVINKIKINDNAIGTQAKRQVGSWDLKNKNGKIVSDGTYLLKGTLKTRSGEKEKISVILGVR